MACPPRVSSIGRDRCNNTGGQRRVLTFAYGLGTPEEAPTPGIDMYRLRPNRTLGAAELPDGLWAPQVAATDHGRAAAPIRRGIPHDEEGSRAAASLLVLPEHGTYVFAKLARDRSAHGGRVALAAASTRVGQTILLQPAASASSLRSVVVSSLDRGRFGYHEVRMVVEGLPSAWSGDVDEEDSDLRRRSAHAGAGTGSA